MIIEISSVPTWNPKRGSYTTYTVNRINVGEIPKPVVRAAIPGIRDHSKPMFDEAPLVIWADSLEESGDLDRANLVRAAITRPEDEAKTIRAHQMAEMERMRERINEFTNLKPMKKP